MKELSVSVVSAEALLWEGQAHTVEVSGSEGELGIKPHHAPLLTMIKPGQVVLSRHHGDDEVIYLSGGLLEVKDNRVTILADVAIRAHDLDEEAAKQAELSAREQLQSSQAKKEYAQAAVELSRAIAQLRAIQSLRRRQH